MSFFKKLLNTVSLGLLGGEDQSTKAAEQQLALMKEKSKLDSANEADKVTLFEETDADTFTGASDVRRKKRNTGGFGAGSNLGLSV